MSTIKIPLVCIVPVALLFCFSGNAQTSTKSASDYYELTVYAGYDGRLLVDDPTNFEGLKIHAFVKADVAFSFIAEDGHSNHLRVSGTVREIDAQDFCLTNGQLEGFGMSTDGMSFSTSETRETRKIIQSILGADRRYSPNDPPEAETSIWWIPIGPGYRVRIKRLPSSSQLTITPAAANVYLSWPTNNAGFILQSTTNLASPAWTTNLPAPVVINGQNVVTNPISGVHQFFRLAQ